MATKAILSPLDVIVTLLAAKGRDGTAFAPIIGRTRLQKMVFLFQKEVLKHLKGAISAKALDFTAYKFGPFSKEIPGNIDFLRNLGFIKVTRIGANVEIDSLERLIGRMEQPSGADCLEPTDTPIEDYSPEKYALTNLGVRFFQSKLDTRLKDVMEVIDKFKATCTSLPLRNLIAYVYKRYPGYTINSEIAKVILGESAT